MFFITLVIACVGTLLALGYAVVETYNINKSSNLTVKMSVNYIRVIFWPVIFAVFFFFNCKLAYSFRDAGLMQFVFIAVAMAIFYLMYQVFDIVDYVVFHNDGDAIETGRASFFRRFASKRGWV